MYTVLFIVFILILIFFINSYIVYKEKELCKKQKIKFNHKRISDKVNYVLLFGIVSMIIGVFLINRFLPSENEKIENEIMIENNGFESSCSIAEDFIKKDLKYPEEAEFSIFDCVKESQDDGSIMVMKTVIAKNAFGVKSKYIYKLYLYFKGGNKYELNNWELISIRSEEVN